MQTIYQETEFTKIIELVNNHIISDYGKALFLEKKPAKSLATAEKRLEETKEAVQLLDSGQQVPFMGLKDIYRLTQKIEKGLILEPAELLEYGDFLRSFKVIGRFTEKNQWQAPTLYRYTKDLPDFTKLSEDVSSKIVRGQLIDDASRNLWKICSQISKIEGAIEKVFSKFLKNNSYLQEKMIVQKKDRYTFPVKIEFQSKIKGSIIEKSNRGTTVFIEPDSVAKLNEQLILAKAEKTAEVYQILAALTGMIAEKLPEIRLGLDILAELDIIFARAKYSRSIDGKPIQVNQEQVLCLNNVCHPLLKSQAVPLSIELGQDFRGLIITGPNAGGKDTSS